MNFSVTVIKKMNAIQHNGQRPLRSAEMAKFCGMPGGSRATEQSIALWKCFDIKLTNEKWQPQVYILNEGRFNKLRSELQIHLKSLEQ